MARRQPPSRKYEEVLELLSSEPLRDGSVSPLRWWSNTLMQELAPAGLDFSADDVKVEGKADFDVEWRSAAAPIAELASCPLSNLPFDRSQATEMKLSTIVQYMRVLRRTQPASQKVRLLAEEALELDRLAGDSLLPGAEAFVAASRRPDGDAVGATSPVGTEAARAVGSLIDGMQGMTASAQSKALIDVAKRAVFGGSSPLLQRVIEDSRFLNCKVTMYERVALNCARVVLKDKAGQVCRALLPARHRAASASPVRSKSKARKVRKPAAAVKGDLARNPFLPSKFVDRSAQHASPGQMDDFVVLSKKGPATISQYQRGRAPSDAHSDPSSMWTPPEISLNGTVDHQCDKCGHSASTASMNWKLDELLQMRKTVEELTEERDKAVALYQDAVTARKRAQKECRDAQIGYTQVEAVIPAMLEGIQDVSAAVACADAEARAQWRQITLIDGISRSMLDGLERVFAEFQHMVSDRETLRDDLFATGKKLRKYRGKLDAARGENAQLSGKLADTTRNLAQSEQERRRAAEEHATKVHEITEKSRLQIETLTREHQTQINMMTDEHKMQIDTMVSEHSASMAAMKDAHAKFVTETHQLHEESMAQLQEERVKEIAALDAQRKQEVADLDRLREQQLADLDRLREQQLADLEARRAQECAILSSKLEKEVKEHSLSVTKLKADHSIVVADLQRDHAREIGELKTQWQLEVDEVRTAWSTNVNTIKNQHAKEVNSSRIEHQRRIDLMEKEACLGTRCCAEKEDYKQRLKRADDECNRMQQQMRDLEAATATLRKGSLVAAENCQFQDVQDALTETQEALTKEKDESQKLRSDLMLLAANHSQMQRELEAAKASASANRPWTQRLEEGFESQEAAARMAKELEELREARSDVESELARVKEESAQAAKELQESEQAKQRAEVALEEVREQLARTTKEFEESKMCDSTAPADTVAKYQKLLHEVRDELQKEKDAARQEHAKHQTLEQEAKADALKYQQLLQAASEELYALKQATANANLAKSETSAADAEATAVAAKELEEVKAALTAARQDAATHRSDLVKARDEIRLLTEQARREAGNKGPANGTPPETVQPAGVEARLAERDGSSAIEPAEGQVALSQAQARVQHLETRVQHLETELETCRQALAEAESSHKMHLLNCTEDTKEAHPRSFEVTDLTARLQVATQDLQHVREQLKACQQSRDDMIRAREESEGRADGHKHELKMAREELRVVTQTMQDSVAERQRLQVLLDSKANYTYEQVQEAEATADLAQETLRKRNMECSELKSLVRKLESELKLLAEDRARQTTREAAERRDVQGRYRVSEDGRRALELEKIQMKAEIEGKDTRIRELKHELLSKRWHMHSGVEEQRREEDRQFMEHLQQELQQESQARENAEAQLEHLIHVGRRPKTKPSHVFKEPLYRAQLLEQNSTRSWGRIASPETTLHATKRSSPSALHQLPGSVRANRVDRQTDRPTSAPPGGRQRALQAKRESLRLQIHSNSPARNVSPYFSPAVPYSMSPPKSDSKVSYGGMSFLHNHVQTGTAARYYGDSGVLNDGEPRSGGSVGVGYEQELQQLRGELREVQEGRREDLRELREAIRDSQWGGGRGLRERGSSNPNKLNAAGFLLSSVSESEESLSLSHTQRGRGIAKQGPAKKGGDEETEDREPNAMRRADAPSNAGAVKHDGAPTAGMPALAKPRADKHKADVDSIKTHGMPSGKIPALEETQLTDDSGDSD